MLLAFSANAGGYLFVTFDGEKSPLTEQIYFGLSSDGRSWQALNAAKPVLVSQVGEKGVRDPFIIRSSDGKKNYLIATDLSIHLNPVWKRAATAGSRSIVVWESSDLIEWSEPRLVKVAADDAGCTWAPEAIYDEETGDYLVYWASANKRDNFAKFRIWAARTKDFATFGEPFIYIERDYPVIDTTIVRENGRYYRFTKHEHERTIFLETSTKLAGPWTEIPTFSLVNAEGYEGPACFPLEPGKAGKSGSWCLLLDNFTKGAGYKAFVTSDLAHGNFEPAPDVKFPFRFRHGTVIPVTTEEYARLQAAYGAPDDTMPGMVGVGTWGTQAEFKDIKVTKGDQTLFESDFSKGLEGWKTWRGHWEVVDGALRQTSLEQDARALIGDPSWRDCTITFKARKLGGAEGFLVLFGLPAPDARTKSWWNVGGWGNSANGVQAPGIPENRKRGRIEENRWYEIKLELSGNAVRGYLDNELVQSGSRPSDKDAQRKFGNALIPDLLADPSIVEFDGIFYCYATTDGMGQGLDTAGLPVVWKSRDFLNWSFAGSIFPPSFDAKYWAPSAPVKKEGRYYLFPTLDNRITAVVSDSPDGPFLTLDGKEVRKGSGWSHFPINAKHPIDAEVFRDDDGQYYMVLSRRLIAKMNRDFTGLDSNPVEIRTKRGGYSEGPALFKRNGIYYYLYTLGGNEVYQYAYMMSRTSVMGPWESPEQDIIATTDHRQGIFGPGHGCFFNPQGSPRWFFVHLEYGRSSTNRQIMAAEMHFNADGTIRPIQLSFEGVGAIRKDPAYDSPNLALGANATASSTRPEFRVPAISDPTLNRIETFSPVNALDGSNGSRWMALQNDAQAWYQLDLGKVCNIERTELYFNKPTAGHAYRLESSVDGKTWQPCGGREDIKVQSPHSDFKIGPARYLRVSILQGSPGLWEFRVY